MSMIETIPKVATLAVLVAVLTLAVAVLARPAEAADPPWDSDTVEGNRMQATTTTRGQGFTTGKWPHGYSLKYVDVVFPDEDVSSGDVTAAIHRWGRKIWDLTGPTCTDEHCRYEYSGSEKMVKSVVYSVFFTLVATTIPVRIGATPFPDSLDPPLDFYSHEGAGWDIDAQSLLGDRDTPSPEDVSLKIAVGATIVLPQTPPNTPRNLGTDVRDHDKVTIWWAAPDGGHKPTHYEYRVLGRNDSIVREWAVVPCNRTLEEAGIYRLFAGTSCPITGLSDDVNATTTRTIRFAVRAVRLAAGKSSAVVSGEVTLPDAPDNSQPLVMTPPPPAKPPLTGSFSGSSIHGGRPAQVNFDFSEEPHGLGYRTVWNDLFEVTGGEVSHVRRAVRGENRRWLVTFTPATANGDIEAVYKSPLPACGQPKAVCTEDGRALTGNVALLIPPKVLGSEQHKAPPSGGAASRMGRSYISTGDVLCELRGAK